jgi:endonuclease/exonuclease/phosphatase family metal-dependent hydrolase
MNAPKPREAFRRDLLACVKEYQQNGFDLLITGDFNEALGSELDGMNKIATETGLIDIMAKHNVSPPPATYARGVKRLDYALASPSVSAALVSAGYEPFNSRIPSDH